MKLQVRVQDNSDQNIGKATTTTRVYHLSVHIDPVFNLLCSDSSMDRLNLFLAEQCR